MQSANPTGIGSTGSNQPTPNPFYEHGETSNSFQSRRTPSLKNKKKPSSLTSKRQTINEEFKPKNPFLQEPIPARGYFLNLVCVTDIRKTLETWKSTIVLNLLYEPAYAEEGRDVTAIYNLIINSFQGIVYNWYQRLSPNILNLIKMDVKRNLITGIEEGIWTMLKYLIG